MRGPLSKVDDAASGGLDRPDVLERFAQATY